MNDMDEVWTTSPQCQEWLTNNGITKAIKVVPHGIERIWEPRERSVDGPLKFLHVGEPTERKGGQIVFDAFRAAFPKGTEEVSLTFKAYEYVAVRNYSGGPRNPLAADKRVSFVTDVTPLEDLVALYHDHHAMIYPSKGEGFGFIPFQAAATGMPTAATEWWCSYTDYLTHTIDYEIAESNNATHLGKWAIPDFDHTVEIMRDMYENYERHHEDAMKKAVLLHRDFNWNKIAADSLESVRKTHWECVYNDGVEAVNFEGYDIDGWGLRIGKDISEEVAKRATEKYSTIYIK